ncbi:MAG TPA: efflux transporter outer membrane subunit, partial [Acetobacteraceae bacterium]|nr:efflux transporter outer membrane subunit [Acetobacteraceae bacterium]
MNARFVSSSVAALATVLSACTMAPHYQRPASPAPASYENVDASAASTAADIGWKDFFPDAELRDLIGRALQNNRDLRIATLNVEAARAQYRIQRSELVPGIDAAGTANNQRTPASVSPTGQDQLTRTYNAGLAMSAFELDLFGRVRSLHDAALESYFAIEENRTAAQLLLVSEVASSWLTLIADRELLRLASETRDSQKKSFDLTQLRFNQGVSSEVELRRSESTWREAEVDIAQQTRRVAVDRNALALLVGEPLSAEVGSGAHAADPQTFSKQLPAGLPADLLARRPDVRAAEHALKAANANIGAARAAFFPSIQLTGFYGYASDDLSSLFQSGHTSWNFIPTVRLPIFAAGANKAGL